VPAGPCTGIAFEGPSLRIRGMCARQATVTGKRATCSPRIDPESRTGTEYRGKPIVSRPMAAGYSLITPPNEYLSSAHGALATWMRGGQVTRAGPAARLPAVDLRAAPAAHPLAGRAEARKHALQQ
jgi:hypothetical protein